MGEPTANGAAPRQTDEADLMPVRVADAIGAAIREKWSPLEVFELMQAQFRQYTPDQLLAWLARFFRLCSATSGRERYAPSFHVDDGKLDRRRGVASQFSGGYEREGRSLASRPRNRKRGIGKDLRFC